MRTYPDKKKEAHILCCLTEPMPQLFELLHKIKAKSKRFAFGSSPWGKSYIGHVLRHCLPRERERDCV